MKSWLLTSSVLNLTMVGRQRYYHLIAKEPQEAKQGRAKSENKQGTVGKMTTFWAHEKSTYFLAPKYIFMRFEAQQIKVLCLFERKN